MRKLIGRLAEGHRLERAQYVELLKFWRDIDRDYLFALAREASIGVYGREIYLRGLIEITNYCKNDCYYCGIRKSNTALGRYRLDKETIMDCCGRGYNMGFRTFVLQGGEDGNLTDDRICGIVYDIKKNWKDVAVTLSLGEKSYESFAAYRAAGADRYLLRHETADSDHYSALHPQGMSFENRKRCLDNLKTLGYQVGAGFMAGSPCQTAETLAEDLLYLQAFRPHMVGIGPFIPQRDTPFAAKSAGSVDLTLVLLALTRLILPQALLPATTALATLGDDGYERGILAGANVVMPNLTPAAERAKYSIYDGKSAASDDELERMVTRILKIGYKAAMARGDHISLRAGQACL